MRFTLAAVALSALTAVNALKLTVVKNVVVNVTLVRPQFTPPSLGQALT